MSAFTSWSRSRGGRHGTPCVASLMDSHVLAGLMKKPILVKIAAGTQSAQSQYGLGASQTPSCASYFHAIFYQMATGTFDDPGGDRHSLGKVAIVTKVGRIGGQVTSAGIYGFASCDRQVAKCGAAAHATGHKAGLAPKYFKYPMADPVFQLRP